jgi:hypothetical protein
MVVAASAEAVAFTAAASVGVVFEVEAFTEEAFAEVAFAEVALAIILMVTDTAALATLAIILMVTDTAAFVAAAFMTAALMAAALVAVGDACMHLFSKAVPDTPTSWLGKFSSVWLVETTLWK